MPGPVQRQYYESTFNPPPDPDDVADNQSVIYASDKGVALAETGNQNDHDLVTGLTQDGTYIVSYEFTGGTVNGQNAGFLCEFRLVRSGNGSTLTVEVRTTFSPSWTSQGSGSGSSVYLAPTMDVSAYCNYISTLSGGVDGMETSVPGLWEVERTISGQMSSGPTVVRDFDMRILRLTNIRAEAPKFDPKSDQNFTLIKGDVVALPIGWQPTGPVAARIDVFAYGPIEVASVEASLSLLSTIGSLGEVAEFEIAWDGSIPGEDEPAEGLFQVLARVIADTPGVGTTRSVSKDTFVTATGCSCKCEKTSAGSSKISVPLTNLVQCPVGPSFDLNLDYCTSCSAKAPQSMGFGWQSKSSCRVFEPSGQSGSLSYQDESGNSLRWDLDGSDYVPAFADNYVEMVKNISDPDATYVLTFKDQSSREFTDLGRLKREVDRNGQAMVYEYDAMTGEILESMTDATGQVVYFDYDGRADGQPRYIRALDAVTGREIELQYDTDDRLEFLIQPGDGATETTQFVYNVDGLLEKVITPTGLEAVTYFYDAFERVIAELYMGDQSVKEIYYDQDARDLADFFGQTYSVEQVLIATIVTDLTETSPDRVTFVLYELMGNMVLRDEMVFPGDSPDPARFNTTVMEYNDALNPRLVTKHIMPNGFSNTMTYNDQGNLASVTESYSDTTILYKYTEDLDTPPLNPKWRNLLREIHRPTVTVNGTPETYDPTEFTYDATYGNLVQIKDAAGNTIDMVVSSDGLVEEIEDRRGYTTVFAYDATTRKLESVTTPAGPSGAPSRTTEFTYDEFLNLESATTPTLPAAEFTYDGQNRRKRTTSPLGLYSESSYQDGLLQSIDMPPNQGSASLRRQTLFLYDTADRLEQVQGQLDFVSSSPVFELRAGYVYDGLSQLKNLVRLKDATQKFTVYDYDFLGRLVRSEDFLDPGRETFIAHADYCTGNLTTTPRGVQREVTYDDRCRLRQVSTQDEIQNFEYDELNRLVLVQMGSRFAAGTSPRVGGEFSQGFFTHETRYTYDELDRVVEVLYPNGETVTYGYNENDDVVRMVDVHGKETLYEYYNDGRLLSVTYEGQLFSYTHDDAGRLESMTYPAATELVVNFSWDDDGRLLSMEYLKDSAAFQRFVYTYDDSGNRITMTETDPDSVTVEWAYGYDWFNRLTSVTRDTVLVESYTYDESDNRITMSRPVADEEWTYEYDLADQIESISVSISSASPVLVESFTPDEDGNILSRTKDGVTTEYDWDTMNRLRQVVVDGDVVETTLYDHGGIRRLNKNGTGKSKSYSSGGMSLADKRPGGLVSFIQGHQLLGVEQGGNFHFYIVDGLGSVRLVVDEAGDVEGAFAHDAWGVPDPGPTPPGSELRAHSYVGGLGVRSDASTGLLYMRQRYYDPQLGRFLNQDPIGFSGGLNLFTYVENSPTNLVDPSGLDSYLSLVAVRGGTYAGAGHVFLRVDPIPGTKSLFKKPFTVGYFPSGVQCWDMKDAYGKGTKRRKRTIVLSQENEALFLADVMANIDAKDDGYPEPKKRWSPVNNCGDWALRLWNDFAPKDKQINPNQAVVKIHPYEISNPGAKKAMKVVDIKTVDPQAIYNILGGEDPGLKR